MSSFVLLTCIGLIALDAQAAKDASVQDEQVGKMPTALCGPACLYLAAHHFKQPRALAEMVELSHCSLQDGTTLGHLETAARALGWHPVLTEIAATRLPKILEPIVIHLPSRGNVLGHFVLLLGDGETIHILDPVGIHRLAEASRLAESPYSVLILCDSWPRAVACEYYLLSCRSPWRARALAALAALTVCIALLISAKIGVMVIALLRRIRVSWLAAVGILLVGVGAGCQSRTNVGVAETEALGEGPLVAEEKTFQAGSLLPGASFTHIFRFQNRSDHNVKIDRVVSSCSCLKPDLLTPSLMAPGASGELKTTAFVESAGGLAPEIMLLAEDGRVLLRFTTYFVGLYHWCAQSNKVYFGDVSGDAPIRALVHVFLDAQTSPKAAAQTLKVTKPCSWVDVEVVGPGKPRDGIQSLMIRLITKRGAPPTDLGNMPLEFSISDSKGTVHHVPLNLMWNYRPVQAYHPAEVVVIAKNGKLNGPPEITFRTSASQDVTRVIVDGPLLAADLELVKQSDEYRAYRSRLRMAQAGESLGAFEGTIRFYGPSSGKPVLEVPYRVRVIP